MEQNSSKTKCRADKVIAMKSRTLQYIGCSLIISSSVYSLSADVTKSQGLS